MALQIAYFAGRGKHATPVYRGFISAEALAVSASSAQSGAAPGGATVARIEAADDVRLAFGDNPTATSTGLFLATDRFIDIEIEPGSKIAAITA